MSKRILLVEDEPSLAMVVQDSLQRKGYQIDHALDGVEALNLFPLKDYQLVILDVMLPHVDGLSVAKEIREKSAEIPILFLTAKSTKEDLIQGYQAGGNDYLRKPFHLEELFFRVQELLGRKIEDTEFGDMKIFLAAEIWMFIFQNYDVNWSKIHKSKFSIFVGLVIN